MKLPSLPQFTALPAIPIGKSAVGLDIGSHSIKIVELHSKGGRWFISNYGHQVIPKSIAESSGNVEMIAELIHLLYTRNNIKSKRVFLTIGNYNVLVRKIQIPKMPKDEVVEAIKWDTREDMMFPPEEAVVDYHVLGEATQEGLPFDEVLAVIAPLEEMERLSSIVHHAGLKVEGILPHPIALEEYDSVWVEDTHKEGYTTCFVDMGSQRTRVYFVTGVEILFSREIPNGGINVTQALVGDYMTESGRMVTVDEKRAEEIKLRYGLPAEGSYEETHDRIPASEIRNRILPVIERQVEEIERSIDSFSNSYIMTTVERVVFTGGAAGLHGFLDHVHQRLDLTVTAYNPLAQLEVSSRLKREGDAEDFGYSMVGAAGCAADQCKHINLYPEHLRQTFSKRIQELTRFAPVPLLILLLAAFSLFLRVDTFEKEQALALETRHLNELRQRFVSLDMPKRKLEKLKTIKEQLLAQQAQLPKKEIAPIDLPLVLDGIASRVSWNMALEQVTFGEYEQNGKGPKSAEIENRVARKGWGFLVRGTIFGSRQRVLKTLEDFLKELKTEPRFADVKLLESQVTDKDKYTQKGLDFALFLVPVVAPEPFQDKKT
ncbi:type IV pilus assembly protein PilM [Nitrospina gracilis]|uniref:type IV pilus assembly protein PilM n=1 Tax=Nitrospina gracilis TaxID=35801 RepID=UPI001EFFEF65|nr:type IV pilus assembly protein PilM [Nitrospina gracilis]MCF8721535.1 type IV pilus assembly protein PilM [Nitrospina gracilis Nb-211]